MSQKTTQIQIPLSQIVTIPPKPYTSSNIRHDNIISLNNYIPSASTIEIIEKFSFGLSGDRSGRMLSITGPYGSGKSTMAIFLNSLLSANNKEEWNTAYSTLKQWSSNTAKTLVNARIESNIHKKGLIRCIVTARREPITVTILRALDYGATKYFKKYSKQDFPKASNLRQGIQNLDKDKIPSYKEIIEIIESMCKSAPILIMIDEFGKNIEYFTTDEMQKSDLFLLQELAEMSGKGRKIPLFIITLQHMAFDEYAAGASIARKREWAKIQGRFEDIPFANSPDQTRLLVSNMIKLSKNNKHGSIIQTWAKNESKKMQNLGIESGFDPALISSYYPLGPLAIEILPELCSRYGQHERTLLSFLCDTGKHTVTTFIDENSYKNNELSSIGIDVLYDYFISGINMIHSSSPNITRLIEIETIIRDSYGLSELERKTLKTIGILNLISRSGYLRASQNMLNYVIGKTSKQILCNLEKKSIITYRKYADEYRIWHGTDIDIAAKLDMYRKRYQRSSLSEMLQEIMSLDPIVAAKHSMKTGTIRLFKRIFINQLEINLDDSYDGVIIYVTNKKHTKPICKKPVILVIANNAIDLRHIIVEVKAIRDILASNEDVATDWVARRELEERLAHAEINLDKQFVNIYGDTAKWIYFKNNKSISMAGTPSEIISKVCDKEYSETPIIRNEMINKTFLSSQGTAAKRKLLDCMIESPDKHVFGLEGFGPDRAIYEAIFLQNKIHVESKNGWKLQDPTEATVKPVWNAILNLIKNSKKRVLLSEIYNICKIPPFGMKDGIIAIFISAILLIHKNKIALYEHGTYVPYIIPQIIERLIKNPNHFEVKYFKNTPLKKEVLNTILRDFKLRPTSDMLDVVSHMVKIVSSLPPYVKHTKKMDSNSLAVRNAIQSAIEPDTLLFESLLKALGFKPINSKTSHKDIIRFSKILTESTNKLQKRFHVTIDEIKMSLFNMTGIENRQKLSKTASIMLQSVSDQKMKVFLNAVASNVLERDEDWINYVALSLTDVPPISWKDDEREMFENNLAIMSARFKRLASIHFAEISDNFPKPSYQIIVTHADGSEHHDVVSLLPKQKKKIQSLANKIIQDMKKNGFNDRDTSSLIAMLSSKSHKT